MFNIGDNIKCVYTGKYGTIFSIIPHPHVPSKIHYCEILWNDGSKSNEYPSNLLPVGNVVLPKDLNTVSMGYGSSEPSDKPQFKPGDSVIIKRTNKTGIIKTVDDAFFQPGKKIYFIDVEGNTYGTYHEEHEFEHNLNEFRVTKVHCECGAHKTVNPNCHSHWCPMAEIDHK